MRSTIMNHSKNITLVIVGVLIILLFSVFAFRLEADRAAEVNFSETEVGFEDVNGILAEEEMMVAGQEFENEPGLDPATTTRGSMFRRYWREFSPEEKQFYDSWQRPIGPVRVGVQAGHWKNDEVPEELSGLRGNTGSSGGGYTERETVLAIAERVRTLLVARGIAVDLLPTTVPVDYVADAFVSIHADGNTNASISGFKIAAPRRDFSGKSVDLVSALYETYETATGLERDPSVSRRMSGYYAFNWRRYDHALHPLTPAAIVETGFMTNASDRKLLVGDPDCVAEGIANGIVEFLESQGF